MEPLAPPRMLIGGEWLDAADGATFEVRSPATGELLATLPDGGVPDVELAVAAARDATAGWAGIDGAERARILLALADRLEQERDRIGLIEANDNGRPLRETGSQSSIVARWFRYFAGLADKLEGETIPVAGPYLNYTTRVPVGVCAAITPWNHPLLIATKKLAPALACGNTIVLKPSELAPLSVLEFGRIALEVGLPAGVLNIVTGAARAGQALAVHPAVDRIDVTGSTATGVAVSKAAAETIKRVGLELGGKSANLVFADADLERAVRGAVFSGYVAQGQSCVAGSRVLVERPIAERFRDLMREQVAAISPGDPLDVRTRMGPLITPQAAERVRGIVARSREQGGEVLTGGGIPERLTPGLRAEGFCEPTLMWTEDPSIEAAKEEIFGPVVTVIPFDDEAEAIAIANDVPYGLGAAVWTGEISRAHRVAAGLRSGIVWINDYHRIDPASPWGGFKLSGVGRENGFETLAEFTEVKSTWVPLEQDPLDWYAPDDGARRLN